MTKSTVEREYQDLIVPKQSYIARKGEFSLAWDSGKN